MDLSAEYHRMSTSKTSPDDVYPYITYIVCLPASDTRFTVISYFSCRDQIRSCLLDRHCRGRSLLAMVDCPRAFFDSLARASMRCRQFVVSLSSCLPSVGCRKRVVRSCQDPRCDALFQRPYVSTLIRNSFRSVSIRSSHRVRIDIPHA